MYFIRLITITIFVCLLHLSSYAQVLLESGIIYGGVTGVGFSTNTGSGTVTSNVLIPPNSTIKKAYLLATRDDEAPNISVVLNGNNYIFSDSTIISNKFISTINTWTWNNSTIHALDIAADVDSSITSYSLTIPPQFNVTVNGFYSSFYLYIIYENLSLSKTAYTLFLNKQDVAISVEYNLANLTPIQNNNSVGLSLFSTFICDTIQDGSYISVNNDTIGLIGGQESNSLNSCTGAYANFAYYNDSLFGLEDDTPDSLMAATDALADIKSNVSNLDTFVKVTSVLQTPGIQGGKLTNPIAAIMLTYTTPCDTFTTTITANDTICLGGSVQLNATGGVQYTWFGAFGGLSDTSIANPIATPTQTTTYIVTIKNDSGCVKTEQVKVWVNPLPIPDTLITTTNFCGSAVGSLQVGNISSNTPPYNYTLTNLQTSNTQPQTSNLFSGLIGGDYELVITDVNACSFTDTVTITEINNVVANFTANPQTGVAPLNVDFTNTSANANAFEWWVMSGVDTLAQNSSLNTQHLFDSSGTYQVCLVAYNNIPICADTVCKTILIDQNEELSVFIPNLFTPNGDGKNDEFVISVFGANLLESLKAEVFNRWGMKVANREFGNEIASSLAMTELVIWDGRTTAGAELPEGTYFYVITYTKKTGETVVEKGSLTLLR